MRRPKHNKNPASYTAVLNSGLRFDSAVWLPVCLTNGGPPQSVVAVGLRVAIILPVQHEF